MPCPSGILNLDKPAGITSNQAVQKVRRMLGVRRVGHGGTLDPMATGVLPVLVGEATRLMEYLGGAEKEYKADVTLGLVTDTLDTEGVVVERRQVPFDLDRDRIESILVSFQGEIQQSTPLYSAARYQGRRLYKLARRGSVVNTPIRTVRISRLELKEVELPRMTLEVTCSKGTYIRQLAADIGERLGCGGCLSALRRTRVGPLSIDEASSLEEAGRVAEEGAFKDIVLPMLTAAWRMGVAQVELDTARKLAMGQTIPVDALTLFRQPAADETTDLFAVVLPGSDLVAVISVSEGHARPVKVFSSLIEQALFSSSP